ncbi:MAG: 16S rRNA (cytosine(1402)-N(4))-methyltransferase RsmH [Desulfobulbaceae bacterium]|nr:16S rRNA (cytosine(1402)-N(4))-methyltransferase RsmH [Desulfobulbaceae bacterium]
MQPVAHVPVLAHEVLECLQLQGCGLYVDGTLGLGGHTSLILEGSVPRGRVIGFEWDIDASDLATKRLVAFGDRFQLVRASYAELLAELDRLNIAAIDGLLVDLGVSSLQLDSVGRGFSFKVDAPLDMRMDTEGSITAADLVQRLSEEELADIFFHYGEERQARRIARFVVEARGREPVLTTRQLADIVAVAVPRKYHPKKIHVATKTFQALRIAVNRELDNLTTLLADAPQVLRKGARVCIITFHSLEDRIVKKTFTENKAYQVVTRRPVIPTEEEINKNPRARSAKLRVADRA